MAFWICNSQQLQRPLVLFVIGIWLGCVGFDLMVPAPVQDSDSCHPSLKNVQGVSLAELVPQVTENYFQPSIELKASKPLFRDSPNGQTKTYYMPCGKNCHPIQRALRELGWQKVNEQQFARLVYMDDYDRNLERNMKTYQRFNHIHKSTSISKWSRFWKVIRAYEVKPKRTRNLSFLLETYRTHVQSERQALQRLVEGGKATTTPWFQRTPDGTKLVPALVHPILNQTTKSTLQRYVCDELVWNGSRFVVRVFWMVASLDPLIVMYQDGFVRIGYAHQDLSDPEDDEEVMSFDAFELYLQDYVRTNRRSLHGSNKKQKTLDLIMEDPLIHIRNQIKESLATIVDAFREDAFSKPIKTQAEDAFEVMAADFAIDKDLHVWLRQVYTDQSNEASYVLEDYYFLWQKVHELWYGMVLTLQDIWQKQARGVSVLPLQTTGKWQLIAAGPEWLFTYAGYTHDLGNPKRKVQSCTIFSNGKEFDEGTITETMDEEEGIEDLSWIQVNRIQPGNAQQRMEEDDDDDFNDDDSPTSNE